MLGGGDELLLGFAEMSMCVRLPPSGLKLSWGGRHGCTVLGKLKQKSAPEAVQCGCDLYGLRLLLQKDENAKDVKGMQWWKSVVPVRQT